MKKSELRSGMLIETRSKKRGIVMLNTPQGDCIVGDGEDEKDGIGRTWFPVSVLDGDLKYSSPDYDIVKVYRYTSNCKGASFKTKGRSLLWERKEEEVEELTMEQLCKELGREVKIKKEEK